MCSSVGGATVEVEAMQDQSQSITLDVDAVENYRPGGGGVETTPAVVRIAGLTAEQKAGTPDGVLVCVSRTNNMTIGGKIYSSWDEAAPWTYQCDFEDCAAMFTLNRWKASAGGFILDVTMSTALDEQALEGLLDIGSDLYLATGVHDLTLVDTARQPQLIPAWCLVKPGGRFQLTGARRWEIEVLGGRFGSAAYGASMLPSATGFIGGLDNFVFITSETFKFEAEEANHHSDSNWIRLLRVLTRTPFGAESLEDGTTASFNRVTGVLTPDWGNKVPPSAW